MGENSNFRHKGSEYQNFIGFFAYTEKNCNSNMFCLQLFFFQNGELKCLKTEKGYIHIPHSLTLTGYPTPGKVVPPLFS